MTVEWSLTIREAYARRRRWSRITEMILRLAIMTEGTVMAGLAIILFIQGYYTIPLIVGAVALGAMVTALEGE
jgi:hypothetical protein